MIIVRPHQQLIADSALSELPEDKSMLNLRDDLRRLANGEVDITSLGQRVYILLAKQIDPQDVERAVGIIRDFLGRHACSPRPALSSLNCA